MNERHARILLAHALSTADRQIAALVGERSAAEVVDAALAATEVSAGDVRDRLAGAPDPQRVLDDAAAAGYRYLIPGDDEWPCSLDELAGVSQGTELGGVPLGLWVRGPHRLDDLHRAVAVVGSRSSTAYGNDVAGDMAADLSRAGRVVISGAAYGIDQAAHRGALAAAGSPTVAVLACGVDVAYPSAHADLLNRIATTGAVVSEVLPGSTPTRSRFLARNRIIAALATGGTVLVEAASRSGARNTAAWATRLHRDLMGVPGPVTSAASHGVHELLMSGEASLVRGADDVLGYQP